MGTTVATTFTPTSKAQSLEPQSGPLFKGDAGIQTIRDARMPSIDNSRKHPLSFAAKLTEDGGKAAKVAKYTLSPSKASSVANIKKRTDPSTDFAFNAMTDEAESIPPNDLAKVQVKEATLHEIEAVKETDDSGSIIPEVVTLKEIARETKRISTSDQFLKLFARYFDVFAQMVRNKKDSETDLRNQINQNAATQVSLRQWHVASLVASLLSSAAALYFQTPGAQNVIDPISRLLEQLLSSKELPPQLEAQTLSADLQAKLNSAGPKEIIEAQFRVLEQIARAEKDAASVARI